MLRDSLCTRPFLWVWLPVFTRVCSRQVESGETSDALLGYAGGRTQGGKDKRTGGSSGQGGGGSRGPYVAVGALAGYGILQVWWCTESIG